MPTSERDIMADNDAHLRHQNPISSDFNKAVVPMWDSSDPERAPPPLPMNPSSPSLVSKSNTSSIIQSAHVALAEKAWETGYVTNPPPKRIEYSPERFMMKGVAHKRIKSLQPGVKDLSSPLERIGSVNGPRSPGKGAGWRGSTYTVKDIFIDSRSPEKESRNIRTGRFSEKEHMSSNEGKAPDKLKSFRYEENLTDSHKGLNKDLKKEDLSRSNTPSPDHHINPSHDISKSRISLRKPQQSILGENIPPQSATMLALQSMASKDEDKRLTNISNSSNALVRTPQTFDAISNQILSLTSIATNLQKEMAQLSRRSKDNATDLISLKEATNARDEDIRRSLRELVHNLSENGSRSSSNVQDPTGFYLNDKLHNYPMPRMKAFSLPRIPSSSGFASSLDRESIMSPASYVADGVAIIALLEKVLREMGTREGQKHIMSKISEFLSREESSTEKKVDDLIMLIKANISDSDSPSRYGGSVRLNRSRTLSIELAPRLELEFDRSQSVPSSCAVALKSSTNDNKSSHENEQTSTIISNDTVNIIRTIKDSVTQGGGLTAEVKALVRELRGEVLGMGREITRKLDEVNEESTKIVASEKEHVSRIVKNGIEDWKTHVDHILREYRRQSSASIASKTSVDHREVCKAVRDAIIEIDKSQSKSLEKEDILNAVREAWEYHKPEIKFQQFWPERDEILNCIKEGIQAFSLQNDTPAMSGATREEVYDAVVEGLKCIPLPCADTVANISREEILTAVRQCLEEFEFSLPSSQNKSSEIGVTRDILLEAVKEGLKSFDFSSSIKSSLVDANLYLTRHEILKAIQDGFKGLEATAEKNDLVNEVDDSQKESCEVSNENFIDKSEMDALISQICEKFKNILDSTRTELEAVTREARNEASSSNATGKLFETTQDWFEKLRADIEDYADKTSGLEIMNAMLDLKSNVDSLHAELERLTSNISPGPPAVVLAEIENLRDMFSASNFLNSEAISSDFLTTLQDGLENIKDVISSSLSSPDFVVERTEILSAIKDGFDCAKEEIDSEQMDVLNEIKCSLNEIKDTVSLSLSPTSSALDKNEIVNAIMEIKETMSSSLIPISSRIDTHEILKAINESLDNFKENMSSSLVPTSSGSDKYEILKAIDDSFDNIKETMFSSLQTNSLGPHNNEILDAIKDVKDTMSSSLVPASSGSDNYEILKAIDDGLDNIKETMFSSLQTNSLGPHNNEILDAIKDVKDTMSSSLVPASSGSDNYEILKAIDDGLDNIKETMFSSLQTNSLGPHNNEILDAIKDVKDTMSSSLVPASSGSDNYEILKAIDDGLDNIKETMFSSLQTNSLGPHNNEILDAIKDVKDTMSSSLVPASSGSDNYEILKAIDDGLDNIKETMFSSLQTNSLGPHNNEILDAIKDVKDTMSSSLVPASSGLDKQEIANTIKEGFENIKDIISSSLIPASSVINKKEVTNIIRDSFDNVKDAMLSPLSNDSSRFHKDEILNAVREIKDIVSSSLVSENLELDRNLVLESIDDSLCNIKSTISSSLSIDNSSIHKHEILNAIKDVKDVVSTSFPSDSSRLHKDEILDAVKDIKDIVSSSVISESRESDRNKIFKSINDGFDSIKNAISSNLSTEDSGVHKNEILNAIKDVKGIVSSSPPTGSLGLQKDEFLIALKDIKDTLSSSLTPESLGLDKDLVFVAINDGFDNIKEIMSSNIPTDHSNVHKDEILNAIKDVKENILPSFLSESLELDKDLILEAINDGFDNIKESLSSIDPTDNSGIFKDEILKAIKDGVENVKDEILSSVVPKSSEIEKDEISNTIRDGLDDIKKTISSSLMTTNLNEDKNLVLAALNEGLDNIKQNISSTLPNYSSGQYKDEIIEEIKVGLEKVMEAISSSLIPGNIRFDQEFTLQNINKSFDDMKETMFSSFSNDKDEILNAIIGVKENLSYLLQPGNSGLGKNEILLTITDSLDNFKDILSSSLVPANPGLDKDEISNAVKDGLESFKETMSTSLVPRNSGLDKDEISNAVKDGLEGFKEILSSSLAPGNSGLDKDELLLTITESLDSFKETMSSSLVPVNTGLNKDEISNAVKDGLESFKETLLASLAPENFGPDKNEISNAVKDGLEGFKEILSSSLAPGNSGLDKDEILLTITDSLDNFKDILSSSLVPANPGLDKDEISNAVKDGLEGFKEILSTSLAPENYGINKDEILITIMDGLERFKETISTSLVPGNPGIDKNEISNAVKDGLEGFKEILSSSLAPGNSGLDKDELLLTITESLDSFKETMSSSLVPVNTGLDKDEISNAVKDGLEGFKEILSTSLAPENYGINKDEILITIMDGLERFKETISTSLVPGNPGIDKNEISNAVKDGLEGFKEILSSSLAPGNSGLDKDEVLLTITDSLESFKEVLSSSLVPANPGLDKDEISNAVKDGLESFKETLLTALAPENFGPDKNEISNAVKDGLEGFKETLSSSLAPGNSGLDKDEILLTITDSLDNFKDILSSSLVPANPGLDKDEISNAVKDGLESFKETMSTSLVPRNSGLDKDEISNAVKDGLEGFKEILSSSLAPGNSGLDKDELLLTITESLDSFKETMSSSLVPVNTGLNKDEISNAVKDGLESFKETLLASLAPENFGPDKNEISNAVKDGLEGFKEILSSSLAPENYGINKDEILITIMDGLERFKETISTSLIPGNPGIDKNEILNTITDGLENIKNTISTSLVNSQGLGRDEILLTITHGLESFKEALPPSCVSECNGFVKDDILLLIKDTIENLRDSVSSKLTSVISESGIDGALQKLKESMDGIKEDFTMQQSLIENLGKSDALDTIKAGLSNVLVEVEKVASKPSALAEIDLSKENFVTLQTGLEDIRADLNRLQKCVQDERTMIELNSSVNSLELLRRDDIESLESLMTDLRTKVITRDLLPFPSEVNQELPPKVDLTDLEDKLKNIQSSITDLALRDQKSDQESIKKEDLRSIENLLVNTKVSIEELDTEPSVTKEDFNALEFLIGETRDNLSNLSNHLEDVSKKDDTKILEPIIRDALIGIENLKGLVVKNSENSAEDEKIEIFAIKSICLDLKNTIDQVMISEIKSLVSKDDIKYLEDQLNYFKEQIDKNTETNSSLFEKRHLHIIEISETIKKFLEEFENSMNNKLGKGLTSVDSLRSLLEDLGQALTRDSKTTDEVKLLSDIIKDGFEKSTTLLVGSKEEVDEKFQRTWDKFDADFEIKFCELLLKYDDARLAAEGANKLNEEKTTRIETALYGTEVAAEDLKLLANHLNTSLTESLMSLDKNSNAVLNGVDATYNRLQEIHIETKSENQQISDDMARVLSKIEAIDNTLKEYGPKTSESINDLVFVANKQYDHSVSSLASLEKMINKKLPKFDLESSILSLPPSAQPTEKYDDTRVHEKLDKLANEIHISSDSFMQLDLLEKIHQQVIKTAAEVSEYFSAQKQQNSIELEENKRASEEINNIIGKKLIEKENIETSVIDLRREEEHLKQSIFDLKAEQEGLTLQKTRLYSEVSSLETALRIRREELDAMEARASNLERRIMESVIDHSRSLLITNKNKGREVMSRKRVPSNNSTITSPIGSRASNMTKLAVDIVTGDNVSTKKNIPGISRRILSLSQITNNLAPGILKRSHSVKASSGKLRKNSWGGTFSKEDENLSGNNIHMRENKENCIRDTYADLGSASNEILIDDETAGSLDCRKTEIDDYSDAESTVVAEVRCWDTTLDVHDEGSSS